MAEHIQSKIEDVKIESDDQELVAAVNHGVSEDGLVIKSIVNWSIFGIVTVVAFVIALLFYAQFAVNNSQSNVNATSTYREIQKLNEDADAILTSFGVVDLEAGVYRIPINEAINKIAND